MRRANLRALAAPVLIAAFAFACSAPRRLNVVFVLVDALRADHLSLYGYGRETSPEIDRIVRQRGILFRNAWATSGCTHSSVSSILTGRWPQRVLELQRKSGMKIPPTMPTLAERFGEQGWSTAAVSTSFAKPRASAAENREMFARGFSTYDNRCIGGPAECVNEVAFEVLPRLPEPFFLYLHYFDPHATYQPPATHERLFALAEGRSEKPWVERGNPQPILDGLYEREPKVRPLPEDAKRLADLYDEEIRYFDARFAELFAELDRRGVLERSVVVLLADHGEELFENGEWGHCRGLAFDSVLRTPLVFFVPGLDAGERSTPASNLDLAPTVFDLLGLPIESGSLDGESLTDVLERGDRAAPGGRVVFAAEGVMRVAASASRTARLDLRRKKWRDGWPGDDSPGALLDAEQKRLRRALLEWIGATEGGRTARQAVREAEALERELKAIGYL